MSETEHDSEHVPNRHRRSAKLYNLFRPRRTNDHIKHSLLYGDAADATDLFSSITRAQVDSFKNVKSTVKVIKNGD